MKVSRTIAISVLMVLILAVGLCYGQGAAEKSYTKGLEYAVKGKFEKAKQEFEKALKVEPFNKRALGEIKVSSIKVSLKVIEDVIDQRIKRKAAIHFFKGAVYAHLGQFDKAIAYYNKAIKINPKFAMAYNDQGVAYYGKGQYDRAISDFNKAIKINPRLAEAYSNRGNAYGKKGQHDRAIFDVNKAIELNPKLAMAYYTRAAIYAAKSKYDQALDDVYKAQALGQQINPAFLKWLRKASGRQK